MRIFIVAILLAVAETAVTAGVRKCIWMHGKNHKREVLLDNIESPYQLAIDRDTNTLFFSFTARTDEMFKTAYFSLTTGRYAIVRGIRGGFANAVDTNTVYMGGEDGIYTFDYATKTANASSHIKEKVNVWQMFYKDGLYFTTYPEEKAYVYKNNRTVEVSALQNIKAMLIAVTNENDILYFNSSGTFLYTRNDYKHTLKNDDIANGFATDMNGNVYMSSQNVIYYFNEHSQEFERLAKINDVYGIAIDSDGKIIYASKKSINRVIPAKGNCTAVLNSWKKK